MQVSPQDHDDAFNHMGMKNGNYHIQINAVTYMVMLT